MFVLIKHRLIKIIEKIPLLQVFVYNNLQYFKFLFPHDKDYYALRILFNKDEKRIFLDIGGNIGLSTIGFRELGFLKNKIIMFEPEPFFKNFNLEYLVGYFTNKKKDIKSFLLDQKFVSGIGNIYASEILFLCKINPTTYASKLTKQDCKKIITYSKSILNRANEKSKSS